VLAGVAAAGVVTRNRDFRSLAALVGADLQHRPDNPAALLRQADLDDAEGRTADAEARFARVTELAPWSSQAWYERGDFLARPGSTELARRFHERAIAANPRHALAHMSLGLIALERGELVAAERSLLEAERLAPENPWIAYNLAVVEEARGNVAGAIARLEQLTARDPTFTPAVRGLAAMKRAAPR
jgi:Flp pilus assembly protein TadD